MRADEACVILGLDPSNCATVEEIESAYRRAALKCHPDKGGSAEEFQRISQAVDVVRDSIKHTKQSDFAKELGLGLQRRVETLFSVVAVRALCAQMGELPFQKHLKFIRKGNTLEVVCSITGTSRVSGTLSESAFRFFTALETFLDDGYDYSCSQDGINIFCTQRNSFLHFTAEEIAFQF